MDLLVHLIDQDKTSQKVAAKLKDLDINVDSSHDDHFALYNTYHNAFENFHHISTAQLVIINGKVTPRNALEILYAVLKRKPIISIKTADCADGVDNLTKSIIKNARSAFSVKDISSLDDETKLRQFLTETTKKPTNYRLEAHHIALIRARVRAFFREAINPSLIS